jgi:uncharacterized protein YdeI (YjbR/CyaY-like superfamily)
MAARSAKKAALTFFATPSAFRAWLRKNHARAFELWVGFYKRESGRPSITWPESVDEALCVGWIDGVRKSLGEAAYCIRFSPRRQRSRWSAVNIRRAGHLKEQGRMREAGLKAFADRVEAKYSFEQRPVPLAPAVQRRFRREAAAWAFWKAQSPWYRRLTSFWVMSAKKPETRERRLQALIDRSARQERI